MFALLFKNLRFIIDRAFNVFIYIFKSLIAIFIRKGRGDNSNNTAKITIFPTEYNECDYCCIIILSCRSYLLSLYSFYREHIQIYRAIKLGFTFSHRQRGYFTATFSLYILQESANKIPSYCCKHNVHGSATDLSDFFELFWICSTI